MKFLPLALSLSVSILGACVVGEDLEHEGDEQDLEVLHDEDAIYDDGPPGALSAFNAGGWVLPAAIRAIGDQQSVAYTGAGAWAGGANCGGGLLAGTREVGDYVKATYAGVSGYGGYACRQNTANSAELSVHGSGRAIDIMIPLKGGDADNAAGDRIANFLVQNAEAIGIQFIIWDRNDWGASRSLPKQRAYGGPYAHKDHIHVELTPAGARRMTPWFSDNTPAPPTSNTATVNASALNLRSGPSTAYSILTTMPQGSTVTIVQGPSNGWYRVTYQGRTGWASGAYLSL
ncbi:MAG: SH3 domain-containing protein [Kofleriaceae bacterium]